MVLTFPVTPLMTHTLQQMSDDECEVVFAINETEEQIARSIVLQIQQERQAMPEHHMTHNIVHTTAPPTMVERQEE